MTQQLQHTRACIARMMICAVENARDAGDDLSAVPLYDWAIGYLDDDALCTCGAASKAAAEEELERIAAIPACWCGDPAEVLVTCDPVCTEPTHTIEHSGWAGEPAIAVCDEHAANRSGQVFDLAGGTAGWSWAR